MSASGVARLAHNTITKNGTGISNSGTVTSTGDNMVDGNASDFSGTAIAPATKM